LIQCQFAIWEWSVAIWRWD